MQKSTTPSPRQTLKLFLLLLVTFGGILTVFSAIYYHVEVSIFLDKTTEREKHTVGLQKQIIQRQFQAIVGDLRFLSEQNELQQFLIDPTAPVRRAAEREYRFLARFQDGYTHLHYIDASGQERIRIHNPDGQPSIAPRSELQNHNDRLVFQETLGLERDEIFISPFDLHIGGQETKGSSKPGIRFGTPVFDTNGTKRGVVLINYLGQNLIDT
ncbi:MAG: cache domain-containing protein, partial [Thermodesulfobacteriota bacterium]